MLNFRALILSFVLSSLICISALSVASEQLDINSASADAIAETMTGIGIKRAEAIIAFRDKNGPFNTVDDLLLVKGIGLATLDKNRDRLSAD